MLKLAALNKFDPVSVEYRKDNGEGLKEAVCRDLVTNFACPEDMLPITRELMGADHPDAVFAPHSINSTWTNHVEPDCDPRLSAFEFPYYSLGDLRSSARRVAVMGEPVVREVLWNGGRRREYSKEVEERAKQVVTIMPRTWMSIITKLHPEWFMDFQTYHRIAPKETQKHLPENVIIGDPAVYNFYTEATMEGISDIGPSVIPILANLLSEEYPELNEVAMNGLPPRRKTPRQHQ